MENSLVPLNQTMRDVVDAVTSGQISTAEDISLMFGLNIEQAVKMLMLPQVRSAIIERTNAELFIIQHTKGKQKLVKLLDSENEKIVLSAFNTIAKLNGDLKSGIEINLNLEGMLDQVERIEEKKLSKDPKTVEEAIQELDIEFSRTSSPTVNPSESKIVNTNSTLSPLKN